MNLKMMNEAFKRKYSNTLNEAVESSDKEALRKALVLRSMNVVANGGSIKSLEIALQDVIENFYPDHCWWEVTDCQIFNELLGGCNPREICDRIVDQLKPEFVTAAPVDEELTEDTHYDDLDESLIEKLQGCLNALNEETMSDEDKRDSDLIRGIIAKMQARRNAKLTPEEQEVLAKYGIKRDTWAKELSVDGRSLHPAYDGKTSKTYQGWNDWHGRTIRNGDPGKINYADRARKLPQRADSQVSDRWTSNGAINAHTRRGQSTLQDVERAVAADRDRKPIQDMEQHLWDRKYHQRQIDGAQDEYDKSVGAARAKYDKEVQWATDTYRRHTVDAEQRRNSAQDRIDRMLKRK